MKNNLTYYTHMANSHNHWKFKTLRRKFGWGGEGRFWALNNMIAESDYCKLDLSNEDKKMSISVELDFEINEFNDFLLYLEKPCKLIAQNEGFITTGFVQEIFKEISQNRGNDRVRKREKNDKNFRPENSDFRPENSDFRPENSDFRPENSDFRPEFEQSKVKESKVKESKVKESKDFPGGKLSVKMPFNSSVFTEAWMGWKDYKKTDHKFSYKSTRSEQAGLDDLLELSAGIESMALAIIKQSISKGWKGLFQLKNNFNGLNGHSKFIKKDNAGGFNSGTKDSSVFDDMK